MNINKIQNGANQTKVNLKKKKRRLLSKRKEILFLAGKKKGKIFLLDKTGG